MNSAARQRCTVLVCSCDGYSDLHRPFSRLWLKYWPDCPFDTVLLTETDPGADAEPCFSRVIACGKGMDWCAMLSYALKRIDTPRVILAMDDYLLSGRVDTRLVLKRLGQAERWNAANLRLLPNPPPGRSNTLPFDGDDSLFRYKPSTGYCIATQTGIWDKDFLADLAEGKGSAWEFERYGSFDRALATTGPLLAARKAEFPFVDAVHKGCWEPEGIAVCRANGIEPDFSRRPRPSARTRAVEAIKNLVFRIVPVTPLVRLQNSFGLGAKRVKMI
ncbi:MAG: hypothetical protein IIT98_07855 [Kiritimatiellae bacterium]|nr:hypothetical protein [Kiritimatiellia bacterium]